MLCSPGPGCGWVLRVPTQTGTHALLLPGDKASGLRDREGWFCASHPKVAAISENRLCVGIRTSEGGHTGFYMKDESGKFNSHF